MRRLIFLLHICLIGHISFAETYVQSDLYTYMISPDGDILRVRHNTYQEDRLHLGLNCVDIALSTTNLYVLNASNCLLFVIDPVSFTIKQSVKLADSPLTLFISPHYLFILHRKLDTFLMAPTLLSIVETSTISHIKEIKLQTPLPYGHVSQNHFYLTGYGCNRILRFNLSTLEQDTDILLKGTVIKLCEQDKSIYILSYDQMKNKSFIISLDPRNDESMVILEKSEHTRDLHSAKGVLVASCNSSLDVVTQKDFAYLITHPIDSLPFEVLICLNLILVFTDASSLLFFDNEFNTLLSTLTLKDVPNYTELYGDFLIISHEKIPQLTVIDLVTRKISHEFPTPRARPILVRTPEYLYVDGKKFLKLERDPV